jgi:hypothetical protein
MYKHTCIYTTTNTHTYLHTYLCTFIHTHTHTQTQTYILYIYKYIYSYIHIHIHSSDPCLCVTDPAGCGTIQKYTKYTNLQCVIQQLFYKSPISNNIYNKIFIYTAKGCACRYFLKTI